MVLGVERFFLGGGDGRGGTDVVLVLGDSRGDEMRASMAMMEKARAKFDAVAAARMIEAGLSAWQIGEKLGVAEMEVRRWAKKHRLGKRLEENEGCVTRKATEEELREGAARPVGKAAHWPEEPEDPGADWRSGADDGAPPSAETEASVEPSAQETAADTEAAAAVREEKAAAYRVVLADLGEEAVALMELSKVLHRRLAGVLGGDADG